MSNIISNQFKKGYIPWNKGKELSEEHRRNIGQSNKGRIFSEETKARVSAALTGRKLSEEHKRKISEFKKLKRKPLSEETKRNIGNTNRGRRFSEEARKRMSEGHPIIERKKARGYVFTRKPEHYSACKYGGYVLEHRLVYEQYHNCSILPWIIVHHINEIRDDNRIENLQCMTPSQHSSHHNRDRRRVVKNC